MRGCVCPQGTDCGIESRSGEEVVITNLSQDEVSRSQIGSGGVIAAVVISLLVLGTLTGCVIVVYYR